MKRKLIFALACLFIVMALIIPSKTTCASGFCEGCQQQCINEGMGEYYSQCRSGGGSIGYCDMMAENYISNCNSVFCSSCGPIYH